MRGALSQVRAPSQLPRRRVRPPPRAGLPAAFGGHARIARSPSYAQLALAPEPGWHARRAVLAACEDGTIWRYQLTATQRG